MSRLRRMLNPETRDTQELRMHAPPAEVAGLCREVVAHLGWSATEREGEGGEPRMTVREDIGHLCCGESPIRLEVELREASGGGTTAVIEGIVPGVGGIASKHLHQCMRAFALLLGRRDRALVQGRG